MESPDSQQALRARPRDLSAALLVLLAALLLSNHAPNAAADDFTGDWVGPWSSRVSGEAGGIVASVEQSGSSLTGTLSMTSENTDCWNFTDPNLTGTVSGNTATFQASTTCTADGSPISLEFNFTDGVFSQNTVVQGKYQVTSNGDRVDNGVFQVQRSTNIIRASAGGGGTISPSGSVSVPGGNNQTFTITPAPGFAVSDILVDGVSIGARTTYTFASVSANYTIEARFSEIPSWLPPILHQLFGEGT